MNYKSTRNYCSVFIYVQNGLDEVNNGMHHIPDIYNKLKLL